MAEEEKSEKDLLVALILSFLFGWTGIDRIYLGHYSTGFLKAVTFGGVGLWWLLDIFLLLTGEMKDGEGKPIDFF
ncbi:TM2 domain-containing protein [Patescibacteria group bacterium]|nr:TM2 domain-containing protein [Patescibacteria group bacterium]